MICIYLAVIENEQCQNLRSRRNWLRHMLVFGAKLNSNENIRGNSVFIHSVCKE